MRSVRLLLNTITGCKILMNIQEIKNKGVGILAASKGRDPDSIRRVYDKGIRIFGESYVQEAEEKIPQLTDLDIEWRFIGHLQRNKVGKAVELFSSIDTVESLELAEKISRFADQQMRILVQVNISGEPQKYGVSVKELGNVLKEISQLTHLKLEGLLSIGSKENPEFQEMKKLFDLYKETYGLTILSMGMSSDYELAIENGATMIRLGRLLFE